jgi:hypothetical protein
MLARYVHKLVRSQLNKRAVRSLEYAMIVMMVAVASVGAVSSPVSQAGAVSSSSPQIASATATLVQLASAK